MVKKNETPAKTTKAATTKTSKKSAPEKAEPVVEKATEKTAVTETTESEENNSLTDVLQTAVTTVTNLESELRSVKTQLKALQRAYAKETKAHEKALAAALKGRRGGRKNQEGKEPRAPSGFAKPTQITPELRKFLSLQGNEPVARTEVTKMITAYIKKHNLQDEKNKKHILPDAGLKKILSPLEEQDKASGYTFFNLQRYMKGHYIKEEAASS